MKSYFISYFEGYDANGRLVFNGNGSSSIEYDDAVGINPTELLDGCCEHLLKVAQDRNPDVVRVAILNLMKVW